MIRDDKLAAIKALDNWFKSQNIGDDQAVPVMLALLALMTRRNFDDQVYNEMSAKTIDVMKEGFDFYRK